MQRLVWSQDRLSADPKAKGEAIYAAYDQQGVFKGYAIPGAGPGFQDTIALIYGFDPAGKVIVGMDVLESRETPGLGDKIYKDAAFVSNFAALAVEPSVVTVKHGAKVAPHEIDAITGATISSKAVGKIIQQANVTWLPRLPPAGAEPALQAPAPQGGAR
jgi:electron transport complex protein RnfG